MTRRRCKRAFCLVSQKVLLNHSSVQRKVTIAVLFGAILECAPQMYKSTWSCGLLLRCRTWWSHFFFWQNGPLTDVQEDEEMDTKKDDEDEDDEQEQEAKSANLLRRIKHQKAPTSGHR